MLFGSERKSWSPISGKCSPVGMLSWNPGVSLLSSRNLYLVLNPSWALAHSRCLEDWTVFTELVSKLQLWWCSQNWP